MEKEEGGGGGVEEEHGVRRGSPESGQFESGPWVYLGPVHGRGDVLGTTRGPGEPRNDSLPS